MFGHVRRQGGDIIRNIRLETSILVDKAAEVGLSSKDLRIYEDLVVKSIDHENGDTLVVISSSGTPVMGLFDGESQLEQINPEIYDLGARSESPVDRTYKFKGIGDNLKLMIKEIRYSIISPDVLNIPIE